MQPPESGTRRTPGRVPGFGKLNDDESALSLPQASDTTATVADATALDVWRRQIDHGLELIDRLCPWCLVAEVDPRLGDSCSGCRELGGQDAWSPRSRAS